MNITPSRETAQKPAVSLLGVVHSFHLGFIWGSYEKTKSIPHGMLFDTNPIEILSQYFNGIRITSL
jgi:hypothetical protein